MENSESKIERVEQKTQQRPRELGDQQRSEEKARELIGARDQEKTLSKEVQQHSDSGSVLNKSEHIPDADERQLICEDIKWKERLKENPNLTMRENENIDKKISLDKEQVAKTPNPTCP